jgi:hypothetical protein
MTPRQRILAALNHQMGDCLTWAPYFRTWWIAHQFAEEIPDFFKDAETYLDAFAPLGLSILDKGAAAICPVYENTEIVVENQPDGMVKTRYITPVGEIYSIQQPTSAYDHTTYKVSYEFKSMNDYPAMMYLLEHFHYEPVYGDYLSKQESIGDAGQYMSEGPISPLSQFFVNIIGYETASYLLHDYPQEMDRMLGVMMEKNMEGLRLAAASPAAPVILTPGPTNADFESPKLFCKYSLPYLKKASEVLHASGKVHVAHMCGKLKALLPLIAQADLDGIESLTPPPFADTYLWEARQALPGVCIIGGVSPHLLVGEWSREQIESYILTLFEKMAPGDNFILSVSDDTPANAYINRFLWISELVQKHGLLPLKSSEEQENRSALNHGLE